jgi:LysM domain
MIRAEERPMAAAADFSPIPLVPASGRSGRLCRPGFSSKRRAPIAGSSDREATILPFPSRFAPRRCRMWSTSVARRRSLPIARDVEPGLDPANTAGALDRAPDAPLRLTRRGVLVLAGVTALIAVSLLVLARASASRSGGSVSRPSTVTVRAGDTLWSIANVVAPTRDPRDVVADLMRLNRLTSTDVSAGQQLRTR